MSSDNGVVDVPSLVADLNSAEPARVAAAEKILEEVKQRCAAVQADLDSEVPERIAAAFKTLSHGTARLGLLQVSMPPPDILGAFGEEPPLEVVSDYVYLVGSYSMFVPDPSATARREAMIVALVHYGRGDRQIAHDIAIRLRTDSAFAAAQALAFASGEDPDSPNAQRAVMALVDNLLDSAVTRDATVTEMGRWVQYGRFLEVVDAMRPRLEPSELARLVVED